MGRTLVHGNHVPGMYDAQARTIDPGVASNQVFEKGSLADEDQMQRGSLTQAGETGRNNTAGTGVPTHCIDSDERSGQELLVGALVDHFAATVETVRGDVVAQVYLTGALLDGQGIRLKRIMGATHIASGTGFFVLLNSHN
jgi:hypothetical protein